MKRYFIVTYTSNTRNGQKIALTDFITENSNFINHETCCQKIKDCNEDVVGDVVITFILEVNEADFKTWNA